MIIKSNIYIMLIFSKNIDNYNKILIKKNKCYKNLHKLLNNKNIHLIKKIKYKY